MRRSERGMTLMELIVASAVLMVVLTIIFILSSEMRGHEKRLPINFMTHPQTESLISRLRKDVQSATSPYYPAEYEGQEQSPTVLILYALEPSGYARTVVWDFTKTGEVHRRAYSAGQLVSDWIARGTPKITVETFEIPGRPYSVRIKAKDSKGKLAIDQILQPRSYGFSWEGGGGDEAETTEE